jgi:hypothetical protein
LPTRGAFPDRVRQRITPQNLGHTDRSSTPSQNVEHAARLAGKAAPSRWMDRRERFRGWHVGRCASRPELTSARRHTGPVAGLALPTSKQGTRRWGLGRRAAENSRSETRSSAIHACCMANGTLRATIPLLGTSAEPRFRQIPQSNPEPLNLPALARVLQPTLPSFTIHLHCEQIISLPRPLPAAPHHNLSLSLGERGRERERERERETWRISRSLSTRQQSRPAVPRGAEQARGLGTIGASALHIGAKRRTRTRPRA